MTEWQRLRIGDVCDIVKGETGLASATPGQYPMVATGAERRSCNTYQFDTEAVCIPLVSSTGHGKKTLNYVHFQSGKFALGTILAAVIPKDPKVLTARYLHLYLSHFKDTVLVPLMKGAANVSLPMKGIASVEIPVPTVAQQQKLIDLIGRIESEHRELLQEGSRQAGLFKQLRQAVLQEAVEGKLTANWRTQHPLVKGDPQHDAATLLAQIKAEKERLVKAGEIRKDKPLDLIANGEKPFELPDGWTWCRLGEVAIKITDGTHFTPTYVEHGIKFISAKDIKDGMISFTKCKFITKDEHDLLFKRCNPEKGDILVSKSGSIGTVVVNNFEEECSLFESLALVKPHHTYIEKNYLQIGLQYSCNNLERKHIRGVAVKHLHLEVLRTLLVALPPLAEQQAIVARVDSLMATIDALEAQVTERKEQAQQLMQAVLREAFQH